MPQTLAADCLTRMAVPSHILTLYRTADTSTTDHRSQPHRKNVPLQKIIMKNHLPRIKTESKSAGNLDTITAHTPLCVLHRHLSFVKQIQQTHTIESPNASATPTARCCSKQSVNTTERGVLGSYGARRQQVWGSRAGGLHPRQRAWASRGSALFSGGDRRRRRSRTDDEGEIRRGLLESSASGEIRRGRWDRETRRRRLPSNGGGHER